MKTLKTLNIIIVVLLATLTVVLVGTPSLVALLAIATSIFFLYYVAFLVFVLITGKSVVGQGRRIFIWTLFLLPLIALLIFPYAVSEFLMQGVHLDMK